MTTEVLAALDEAKEKVSVSTQRSTDIENALKELVASLDLNMPYILGGSIEDATASVIALAISTAHAKSVLGE